MDGHALSIAVVRQLLLWLMFCRVSASPVAPSASLATLSCSPFSRVVCSLHCPLLLAIVVQGIFHLC